MTKLQNKQADAVPAAYPLAYDAWLVEFHDVDFLRANDAEESYKDLLDEYPVEIGSLKFAGSYALEQLDPVAYRCGFSDYLGDYEEFDIPGEGICYLLYDLADEYADEYEEYLQGFTGGAK